MPKSSAFKCECGKTLHLNVHIAGNATFHGCTTLCPFCGRTLQLDGALSDEGFVGRVQSIVKAVMSQNDPAAAAAAAIASLSAITGDPKAADATPPSWLKQFLPQNRDETFKVTAMLLTVLQILVAWLLFKKPAGPSAEDIRRAIQESANRARSAAPAPAPTAPWFIVCGTDVQKGTPFTLRVQAANAQEARKKVSGSGMKVTGVIAEN